MNKAHIRFQAISLSVGIFLLGGKFLAFWLTGSKAIFSDAMESIVNVAAGLFSLYSLILAARPRDRDHPYGHGKIEFISAGIEGTLIIMAGLLIIFESIGTLLHPQPLAQLDLGIWITVGAGAANFLLGWGSEWHGKRIKSDTLVASGHHLRSDAYTSAGLVIGLIAVHNTGWWWIDSMVAVLFAAYIVYVGVKVLRGAVAGIMDEADLTVTDEISALLDENRRPYWVDVHNLRMIRFGAKVHIDCHLTLPWYITVEEAHHEVDVVEKTVSDHFGEKVEMFIHTDPCIESSCASCILENCMHRKHAFAGRLAWDREAVLTNSKHGLSIKNGHNNPI